MFVIEVKDGPGKRETAKILDFGVAKVAGSAKLTRTGHGLRNASLHEPRAGERAAPIDHRTDVYALGVIMYEMFTGRVPFEADTYMGVLTKHMFEAPLPPSQVAGPARELGALEDVTLKALAKRAEERYGSMIELVADLDRVVQVAADGPISVARAGRRHQAPLTSRPAPRRSAARLAMLEPRRRARAARARADRRRASFTTASAGCVASG